MLHNKLCAIWIFPKPCFYLDKTHIITPLLSNLIHSFSILIFRHLAIYSFSSSIVSQTYVLVISNVVIHRDTPLPASLMLFAPYLNYSFENLRLSIHALATNKHIQRDISRRPRTDLLTRLTDEWIYHTNPSVSSSIVIHIPPFYLYFYTLLEYIKICIVEYILYLEYIYYYIVVIICYMYYILYYIL